MANRKKPNINTWHYVQVDEKLYFTNLSTESFLRMKYEKAKEDLKGADDVIALLCIVLGAGTFMTTMIVLNHFFPIIK